MKNNIILIGMPGCGKSTVGVLLAKLIGFSFIDSDLLIQQSEGRKLFEIINEKGNDYFAYVEERINSEIDTKNTVIATGGSVIYGEKAMKHLKEIGTVVFLRVELCELERRITNLNTRGIVFKDGEGLSELFLERMPLYEKYADIIVDCNTESLLENAEKIAAAINM